MQDRETSQLQLIKVIHKETGEIWLTVARDAQDACTQAGWLVDNCYVTPQSPTYRQGHHQPSDWYVKLPCQVCPFQYTACNKPAGQVCPVSPQAPELQEWLKQAAAAHICSHQGQPLMKADHQNAQKWVTMEEAISELRPQSIPTADNTPQ